MQGRFPLLEQSSAREIDGIVFERLRLEFEKKEGPRSGAQGHKCGRGCNFWCDRRAPNHYVCTRTARIHVCGAACRAASVETPELTRVCTLTGTELPGRGYMNSYADYERVLPPSQYDHARERARTRRFLTHKNLVRDLRAAVPARVTDEQLERVVQVCCEVYTRLCAACKDTHTWERDCTKSQKTFVCAMVFELSQPNPATGAPVPLLRGVDFAEIYNVKYKYKLPIAKMQKKIRRTLQKPELRCLFDTFAQLNHI